MSLDGTKPTWRCSRRISAVEGIVLQKPKVPHVVARETHQRSLKFSYSTRKRLFRQHRPRPDNDRIATLGIQQLSEILSGDKHQDRRKTHDRCRNPAEDHERSA
jgi:hypothetical protein